jgi:hypothetical protein
VRQHPQDQANKQTLAPFNSRFKIEEKKSDNSLTSSSIAISVSQNSQKNSTTQQQSKKLPKSLKLRLSDDEDRELHIQHFLFAIPPRFPLLLSQNLNTPTTTTTQPASQRAQRNQMRRGASPRPQITRRTLATDLPTYLLTYLPTDLLI